MKRSEIYLKAAKLIYECLEPYACHAIQKIMYGELWYSKPNITKRNYPEFFMFKPKEINMDGSWFDNNESDERITALLFAHKLAKDTNN